MPARPRSLRFAGILIAALVPSGSPLVAGPAIAPAAPSLFKENCVQCHNKALASGGINLEKLTSDISLADDFRHWKKIAAVLEDKRMPPPGVSQPSESQRKNAAEWVRTSLNAYIAEHAGDPGAVTVRRLTSSEYRYTIQDLTGLDLDATVDVAADSAGGEGFTNYGGVQFMSEADLERYLAAAKRVADHAVIGTGPLSFFADPGMSGFELSAISRIHDIYREHGFRAVAAEGGRAFGLEKYAKAFFVAWQYQHRGDLGKASASLDELARAERLSPQFAQHVWTVVQQAGPSYPTSEVVSRWQALPSPGDLDSPDDVRSACTEIQQFVINWPRRLFAAGDLAAGGAGDERALVITSESLTAQVKQHLRFGLRDRGQGAGGVYLSVVPMNPGSSAVPVVIWRDATVRIIDAERGRGATQSLREALQPEAREKLGFGQRPDGGAIGPNDFVTEGEAAVFFEVPTPPGARGLEFNVDVELGVERSDDAVMRIVISDSAEGSRGRPTWALLADPTSTGFDSWRSNVLEYAANLPQTSHGEPTPSDRDPIPAPFNNVYNQPERDRFHFRVKYFRNDNFIVGKMLDSSTRRELDNAWLDLRASFEFHDAILDFVDDKYTLELGGLGIADLDAAEIEAIPSEPKKYVSELSLDYDRVVNAQLAAQPGHLEDTLRLAARAWRRPLSADENDALRGFYVEATERGELDHRSAIRALIARILVAPSFLYRWENAAETSQAKLLTDWEIANRLSYFLWSSAPDGKLRTAADEGLLSEPAEVTAQLRRMLTTPKARRLAVEFFGQWLGFYRFDQYRGVDSKRFPEFDDELKSSMYDEAVSFFDHVIRNKRPIREIISADYGFLNDRLAEHYGLEGVTLPAGKAILVEGVDKHHRGGLVRLGAVLTATSAPLRTSPVKRGDWMLRRILGNPTPPPPADAGSLPSDVQEFGGQTVREQLESHRRNPSCMSCHSKIDPLGFPLENYDAIGRWRNEYSNGQPIDATTEFSDGTEVNGVEGLLAALEDREDQVLRTFATKLLGYALGRTIIASDEPLIDSLVESGGDATFADLATQIVSSKQFRYHQ